jgi:hypothetical protein
MPQLSDSFDGGNPCAGWGYQLMGSPAESLVNGALVLLPVAPTSNTGCTSAIAFPFGSSGVFVDVQAVGTGLNQYNGLQVFWTAARSESSTITVMNGTLGFSSHAVATSEPYGSGAARWWRIRPSADRQAVIAEVSGDGLVWRELGRDPLPPPAMVIAQIQSGLADGSAPTPMQVASFDVCP